MNCPFCFQTIPEKQSEKITKSYTKELDSKYNAQIETLKIKYDEEINILTQDLQEKENLIQTQKFSYSEKLDRILVNNTEKINEINNNHGDQLSAMQSILEDNQEKILERNNIIHELKLFKFESKIDKEINLLELLQENFPNDEFALRGNSEADIVQTIRHKNNFLDVRICYDDKQLITINKTHIEKAQTYQHIHSTRYILIVSTILPKNVINSYFGVQDNILLVHPKILIEIIKLLRENIISIYSQENTQTNRDTKEVQLYNFITSDDFATHLRELATCYSKLDQLLQTEITSHKKSWKLRKKVLDELFHTKIDIEQEISLITEEISVEVAADKITIDPGEF